VHVGDEGDDDICLGDGCAEFLRLVGYVESDSCGRLVVCSESLGDAKSAEGIVMNLLGFELC